MTMTSGPLKCEESFQVAPFPGPGGPWKICGLISWRQSFFWTFSWSSSFPNCKSNFRGIFLTHQKGLCSPGPSSGNLGQSLCWALSRHLGSQRVDEPADSPPGVGDLAVTQHQGGCPACFQELILTLQSSLHPTGCVDSDCPCIQKRKCTQSRRWPY